MEEFYKFTYSPTVATPVYSMAELSANQAQGTKNKKPRSLIETGLRGEIYFLMV